MVIDNIQNKVSIFISYSHKDEDYKESLEEHLAALMRRGKISSWSDRKIVPGTNWESEIDHAIDNADIILLLISPSFIASGYCYEKELAVALSRHEREAAVVIPIFVRPTDLMDEPLMGLQGLPKDALSISEWENEDLAWRDVVASIRTVVDELHSRKERRHESAALCTLQDALKSMIEGLDQLTQSDGVVGGVPTGLVDVDQVIDGLHQGQLITIASRPGMGKTNLSLGIAGHIALLGLPVLIFSTQNSTQDVMNRLVSIIGRISYAHFLRGRLGDEDWARVAHVVQKLSESEMLFDDSTELSLEHIRDSCLSARNQFGALGLVLIDSINYLGSSQEHGVLEGGAARSLKTLARELMSPVIVTAPLSRSLETRVNKRPLYADLHGWHGLGDESDVLAFIYRDEYYNIDTPERGVAEFIVEKNKYGPAVVVRLLYDQKCGVFINFPDSSSSQ